VWTGREYIFRNEYRDKTTGALFLKSNDFSTWEPLIEDNDLGTAWSSYEAEYYIRYWGDRYIVYSRGHETPVNIVGALSYGQTPSASLVYTLDGDFNLINKASFEKPVTSVRYINGKYYLQTQDYRKIVFVGGVPDNTIYVSDDAVNWTVDESLTEIPLSNGTGKSLLFSGVYDAKNHRYNRSLDQIAQDNDLSNKSDIVFENALLPNYDIIEDIYISVERVEDSKSFKISKDGVYWMPIAIPEVDTSSYITGWLDLYPSLIIETSNYLLEYDINELREELNNRVGNDPVYVKLDDTLLGFETTPIIEGDRTLVPMRFLFEQMGADVEWDQETQTATATTNHTAVVFSINDTSAEVNGTAATMDVPARLINDKTMVPLRFLSEELGYTVTWDEVTRTAVIE
ncbi:MAG: copper amine oxidase N-terminal domain-containing protein, partial [bacterium]|nr:copper amine oxidase N-terminal domain-containing protein [bacterium]